MSEELKACPFCGIKPELASLVTPVRYFYLCPNCGIGNELQGFDRDEARRFWNTRPIEDKLQAELARRDERIAELEAIVSPASFRKFLVEQIKDPELAEAYVKACIQDTTYKELLASRDKIITRLKEDAERLADIADMFGDDAIAVLKHRALMRELGNLPQPPKED